MKPLTPLPTDIIFQLWGEYQADPREDKANLAIGQFADEEGNPYVMPSIQSAARQTNVENFNYFPMGGDPEFRSLVAQFVLGDNAELSQVATQATCGGTQACRLYTDIWTREEPETMLWSTPTWPNHKAVFDKFRVSEFPHLNTAHRADVRSYATALEKCETGSHLLLHGGAAHNPTGMKLTQAEIEELIPLMQKKQIKLFIDFAYPGLGNTLSDDLLWVRTLWEAMEDVSVGVSFSKIGCLYRHRTGVLLMKSAQKRTLESYLVRLVRASISTPPAFGQEVMHHVLRLEKETWTKEIEAMRQSINIRREALVKKLPESFQYLNHAQGLFGILPLNKDQIERLKIEHGVYLLPDGRVNFSGLEMDQIDKVSEALQSVGSS